LQAILAIVIVGRTSKQSNNLTKEEAAGEKSIPNQNNSSKA
jgi:hypothetical protein